MNSRKRPKVLIALNMAWNLYNFRSGLIQALVANGYEVVTLAPHDDYAQLLPALGCRYIPIEMDNRGTHPGRDLLLLWRYIRVLRHERPDIYLGYTVKPNIYGSFAAHLLGIPVINNIAGLGSAFRQGGLLARLVSMLYRQSLSRSVKVFFQNNDDLRYFVAGGLVAESVTASLPGSGVDINRFRPRPLPNKTPIRFLLPSRLLWEKGVSEFVAAAALLKQRNIAAECCLLGFLDANDSAAIPRSQIDEWVAQGDIRYLGSSNDVRIEMAQADCVVLPTFYKEGTPRSLLEAAAMGRPIITTDSVGCRDVVDDGVTGLLCRPKDAADLAEKMSRIVSLSSSERVAMGLKGREKIASQYDEEIVIQSYLEALESVLGCPNPAQ